MLIVLTGIEAINLAFSIFFVEPHGRCRSNCSKSKLRSYEFLFMQDEVKKKCLYIPHLIINENYTVFIHDVSDFQFSRVMQLAGSMENIYLVAMENNDYPLSALSHITGI